MVWKLSDGKQIKEGTSWVDAKKIRHPSNWGIWTDEQKKAAGLTWTDDPAPYDNRFYWGKVRKLSMTLNLTDPDDYSGGDLKFDFVPHMGRGRFKTCKEIRPRGSIIIFPSFIHHQVTPVTKGTRYSAVIWSLGRPFR